MDEKTYQTCLNIAKGCHDYNGGHHDKNMNETFHHGIQTVINCLVALKERGLQDTQLAVVHNIGKNLSPNPIPMRDNETHRQHSRKGGSMKLEEAVMSGKPFRRKDFSAWMVVDEDDFIVYEIEPETFVNFTKSDITADDYELKEG